MTTAHTRVTLATQRARVTAALRASRAASVVVAVSLYFAALVVDDHALPWVALVGLVGIVVWAVWSGVRERREREQG